MNLSLPKLDSYQLNDRYRRGRGRVFLTGTQALVRLPLLQRELDRQRGLNTAGFVSGYRGSPLGGYDQALWAAEDLLRENDIDFMPAINEDLAATAILGTQQVEGDPDAKVDGVFSIWYGKGPGVDRAGDALKHGNAYGSSPHGGVLVVAGDDHGCVSSSMSHQSDVAFMAWFMPTLNPASVQEYLEFGLFGFALSRFSGVWVGFKAISETVESAASVTLPGQLEFAVPDNFTMPESGLHYRWPDFPGPQVEARMVEKLDAVRAFARVNRFDKRIYDIADARFGIVTTGKGHLDLMEALALLGIDAARARELGIDVYKVGMVWPLETLGARAFLRGKEEVLVVEEKRGIIESELKEALYDFPGDKPSRMVGKYDEAGRPLVPWTGELSPALLAPLVARRITHAFPHLRFDEELAQLRRGEAIIVRSAERGKDPEAIDADIQRRPYFCSGCPHNTSTKVPEGSKALAGIGCHFMASWMDRSTESLVQMGGEGVSWVGKSRFIEHGHIFQNLGEGTYFHSGYLAIRQALAAGADITYKILFNDAVAMTGGQAIDGSLTVNDIANQVRAEGVQRICVVADDPGRHQSETFPAGTTFHHRDDLDDVQRELREVRGVSVLIYDQVCATELRRQRKRGLAPEARQRVYINPEVCEGCGDCSAQSNCLSIFPLQTEFGRKRQIDQSSCNVDLSCVKGFCPSFVTVRGGKLKTPSSKGPADLASRAADLPVPKPVAIGRSHDLLITGVGGTGVTTIGALVTMAAHLEGKGASVLDFMGFAQKGGAVLSYVRLAAHPGALHQVRIDKNSADAVIACDVVVGTSAKALDVLHKDKTRVVANQAEIPTGDFVGNRDADFTIGARIARLQSIVGAERLQSLDANALAKQEFGHTIYANVIMLGFAWQTGLVPLSASALERAMELNGVNVGENKSAFLLGRLVAAGQFETTTSQVAENSLEDLVAERMNRLTTYQNAAYAERYRARVETLCEAAFNAGIEESFAAAVAKNLYKVMAYKDEYEVARLFCDDGFRQGLNDTFEPGFTLQFHLAPPLLARGTDSEGRPRKLTFGGWTMAAFRLLAKVRFLRGTRFDPFGYTADRKLERRLLEDYEALLDALAPKLTRDNVEVVQALVELPEDIRGYGPVKARAAELAEVRRQELLAELERTGKDPELFYSAAG